MVMSEKGCPTLIRILILITVGLKFSFVDSHTIGPWDEESEISVFINVLNFKPSEIPIGSNITIMCRTTMTSSTMQWLFNSENITDQEVYSIEKGENIEESGKKYEVLILHIFNIDLQHVGQYTCLSFTSKLDIAIQTLNVTMTPRIISLSTPTYTKMTKKVKLQCTIQGYPIEEILWFKNNELLPKESWEVHSINQTFKNSSFEIDSVNKNDNGTYTCRGNTNIETTNQSTVILVLDKPQVNIDFIKSIGVGKIYLNWTVNDGNDIKHLMYRLQYKSAKDSNWFYYPDKVEGSNKSYILKMNFENDTEYTVRIMASNQEGDSQYSVSKPVSILSEEPVFIPEVKVTGVTVSSITIKWSDPPEKLDDLIHYYQLISSSNNSLMKETIQLATTDNLYMFSDLQPATAYIFQVSACSDYTNTCGPPSDIVNGTTMDGISGPPSHASIECRFDNISQKGYVSVSWTPPVDPHGTIMSYNVNVDGSATFNNEQGNWEHITWGPKITSVGENTLNTRFYNASANTNYTVRISGVTRTKRNGEDVELKCSMPPTLPDKQKLSGLTWRKIEEQLGKYIFKLNLPRISERNGPICCYRIYLVRMEPQQKLAELPEPEDLLVISYQEAHRTPKGGTYVAEMFDSFAFHPEVFLGDDKVYNSSGSECDECIGLRPYSTPRHITSSTNSTNNTSNKTVDRVKRNDVVDPLPPYDGSLDMDSNYTGFVEILVHGQGQDALAAYSNYFVMMNAGPEVVEAPVVNSFSLVMKILCGLMLVIFLLLFALIVLHRYTKQAHAQAVEMITFRTSLRSLRGRQRLVSLNPPDMCPINKKDLLSAYIERHRDSDYGFQQEFELLPDRFTDRTTRASDSRDNVYKNRYPDIKSYDQTRVKLSQVDSIAGSDYINANYVLSYRERKKFICAQGPMDTTVNDFWRMIWEQHLELILMLTNLEEYSKTKCAKYWPDKVDGDKTFGDITVTHLDETRYSDYLIRNLKICRKNGMKEEERRITQYHYLVWKDFMAPEHPNGIIKFIKRINEIYSLDKGCILVHCSAGVGRTGTLVALDCLLQQLKDEGQVSIFNTICDLRHQRNFLVQSLKQYIFIYRALMEVAQYGDQEINADDLKTTTEKAKKSDINSRCKLEEQFEKIVNAFEDRKSTSVALAEENREKNRSEHVVPYDRNRVILTPLPGREHSTYINATFIEGYDNTESFIITQDPMETTVNDFWRMVSEQGISVIVMLSELGEGKCPRYWPEDENCYEHIMVRYVQAESCPYYTRREMYVKSRDGEETKVTHLQYHGWPTVDGEVPEVTRGLTELVDHSQTSLAPNGCSPSMIVHCKLGTLRSSMFVGLSILVQQLRSERRVDIFTLTRKLRSQRLELLNTYAQYEFLHRAIVNYAELHGLCNT